MAGFPSAQIINTDPFTIQRAWINVTLKLTCHCGGAFTDVLIVDSVAAECAHCQRAYNAKFNVVTMKLEIAVKPPPDDVDLAGSVN